MIFILGLNQLVCEIGLQMWKKYSYINLAPQDTSDMIYSFSSPCAYDDTSPERWSGWSEVTQLIKDKIRSKSQLA